MEEEKLEELIIKNYKEYLDNELLEDTFENIERYISTLYYELLDDIELNKDLFGIEQEMEDYEAIDRIEKYIENILKNR